MKYIVVIEEDVFDLTYLLKFMTSINLGAEIHAEDTTTLGIECSEEISDEIADFYCVQEIMVQQ